MKNVIFGDWTNITRCNSRLQLVVVATTQLLLSARVQYSSRDVDEYKMQNFFTKLSHSDRRSVYPAL